MDASNEGWDAKEIKEEEFMNSLKQKNENSEILKSIALKKMKVDLEDPHLKSQGKYFILFLFIFLFIKKIRRIIFIARS